MALIVGALSCVVQTVVSLVGQFSLVTFQAGADITPTPARCSSPPADC